MSENYSTRTAFLTMWNKAAENIGLPPFPNNDGIGEWCDMAKNIFSETIDGKVYFALCDSAEGNRHLHIAVKLDKPSRIESIAKKFGNSHIEPVRGTAKDLEDYILKQGKFTEKGELVLWNNLDEKFLEEFDENALFDKNCLDLNFDIQEYFYEKNIVDFNTRQRLISRRDDIIYSHHHSRLRNVKVCYIEGDPGSGKSYQALGMCQSFGRFFRMNLDSKSNFPWDGYDYQPTIWLDELRFDSFKPSNLYEMFEGYPDFKVNVKGGRKLAVYDRIVISSCPSVWSWYYDGQKAEKGQDYRDNYQKQFIRRITSRYKAVRTNDGFKFFQDTNWDITRDYFVNEGFRSDTVDSARWEEISTYEIFSEVNPNA